MISSVKKSYSGIEIIIRIIEFVLILTIILDCNSVYRAVEMNVNPRELAMLLANICAYSLLLIYTLRDKKYLDVVLSYKYLFLLSLLFVLVFNALNVVNSTGTCFFGYFLFFMNAMMMLFGIYRKNG